MLLACSDGDETGNRGSVNYAVVPATGALSSSRAEFAR
jgi:hypothetical protein